MEYWSELEETNLLDTEKREEIYRQKIEDFLNRFILQDPDSIIQAFTPLIKKAKING